MRRFFFHLVSGKSRCEDATGTLLPSLADVLHHGETIASALTKHGAIQTPRACDSTADDFLEIEDQDSTFFITLPFTRLLSGAAPILTHSESQPIDLAEHRLARRYTRAVSA
jgi:hypothetical protein